MWINVLTFVLVFIFTFLGFYFLYLRKLKRKSYDKITELNFLIRRFDLKKKELNFKRIVLVLSIINAFIIAFVATMLCIIPSKNWFQLMLGFMVAFVVLMALIYALYEIYGRYLQRKWGRK